MVSGTIHNNGMAAMFWLRWLVTAESRSEPQAARSSHKIRSRRVGIRSDSTAGGAGGISAGGSAAGVVAESSVSLVPLKLIAPHTTTKIKNPADHTSVCTLRLKYGSIKAG